MVFDRLANKTRWIHVITFSEEKFADAWPEFQHLAQAHWDETMRPVSQDAFRPDVKRFTQYNETGFYRLYIARKDGIMVGDLGVYISDSMHTQKRVASEDSWYMVPEVRNGRTALRFVQFVEDELKKLGVTSIDTTTPPNKNSRKLLEFLGYKHIADHLHKEI